MQQNISLTVFALTYLPAAMLAGGSSLVVLVGYAFANRGAPSSCADAAVTAGLVSLTLLTAGAPMLVLGLRACGSAIVGGAPVWTVIGAAWALAALDIGGCAGAWAARLPPVEVALSIPVGFAGLSFAVFLRGLWVVTGSGFARGSAADRT